MKDDFTISDKHVPLRIAAFVLAFIVAVGGITAGVVNIGRKQAGYNTVEPDADQSAPLYSADVTLTYLFTGSRSEIKEAYNAVQKDYSAALSRAYKLLDAENTYTGLPNLASLAESGGEAVELPEELYTVLLDALEKTRQQQGYNMFAGALYAAWTDILILEEPEPFDPVNDPTQAGRLQRLSKATADLGNFSLEIADPDRHSLRFAVSEAYLALLEELEIEAPVLELNLLREAYELSMVRDALEAKGWKNGYLESRSGLTLLLSGQEASDIRLYGMREGKITPAAVCRAGGGTAASSFRAFALTEDEACYYRLTDASGQTILRHPFVTASGEFTDVLSSSLAVSGEGDPAAACWANIRLWNSGDTHAAENEDLPLGWTLQKDSGQKVYINPACGEEIVPAAEYGWTRGN